MKPSKISQNVERSVGNENMTIWESLAKYATIETKRLILRPFSYKDMEELHLILSHPANTNYIMPSVDSIAETRQVLVTTFMVAPLGIWAIEEKVSGDMIGCIRFEHLNERTVETEIGYFLNRFYWGFGFMTEALQKLVSLALEEMGIRCLKIITHIENKASQRVALKAGFYQVGHYKGSDRYSHKIRRYLEFRLTAADYLEK